MGEEIEDLVEIVMTVLPPPQTQMNLEEEVGVDQKEIAEGDQMTQGLEIYVIPTIKAYLKIILESVFNLFSI